MSRRELLLLTVLGVISLLLFFALFERVEETVQMPPQGEAARNDTLAFERLAEARGVPVAGERVLERMPPDDAALLLLADRSALSPGQIDELFDWIGRGGVLIVPATIPWDSYTDQLEFEDAASETQEVPEDAGPDGEGPAEEEPAEEELDEEEQVRRDAEERRTLVLGRNRRPADGRGAPLPTDPTWGVSLIDDPLLAPFGMATGPQLWWQYATVEARSSLGQPDGLTLSARTYRMPRLEVLPAAGPETSPPAAGTNQPTLRERLERSRGVRETDAGSTSNFPLPVHGHVSDQLGALAIWAHVGEGTLVALHDAEFLFNDLIGEDQNARLAWHLLRDAPTRDGAAPALPSELLVVRNVSFPTLGEVVLERGGLAVAASLVLLFFWLWRESRRTAPMRRSPRSQRERNLAEHLRASARFFHRQKLLEILLASLQRRAERAAYRAQPGLEQLPGPARLEGLARRADLPRAEVSRALASEIVEDPGEFTERVATLQRLHQGSATASPSSSPLHDRPSENAP